MVQVRLLGATFRVEAPPKKRHNLPALVKAGLARLLNSVRTDGDWEGWITFFLEGVAQAALGAVETTRRLEALSNEDRLRVQTQGRRAGSALRVLDVLRSHPLVTLTRAAEIAGLSYPAASSAMEVLVHLDIAREISGRQRNRVYSYERYLAILSQGT
jgi:Fic family protein